MVAELQIQPMTQEEFDAAKHVTLDPIECLRCGRWLISRASIVRGYGAACALSQALEELSHGSMRNPRKTFAPKPVVEFFQVSDVFWEVTDYRGLTIGELRQTKNGAWSIVLWDRKVDLDADLQNAKRRVARILERMGR
jgi:hypothetical protein